MNKQLELQPFTDSTPIEADAEALRQRMERDGYLFLAVLIPKADIASVYNHIVTICRKCGGWMPMAKH